MPTEGIAGAPARGSVLARLLGALRQVTGMPDYPRYQAHMQARHPGCRVLSEKEFYEEYVNSRYGNGASRCC